MGRATMQLELIYQTPQILRLVEMAGRTCYRSERRITDDSAEGFVSRIVGRGHESVIEHSNLVFATAKVDPVAMVTALRLNRFLAMEPSQLGTTYLAGNTRMFKDLIRSGKAYLAKQNDSAFAELIAGLIDQLYLLPAAFFADFVAAGWMDESRFATPKATALTAVPTVQLGDGQEVEVLNLDSVPQNMDNLPHKQLEPLLTCTVRVKTSRDSSLQEVRHRPAAYSQESQRYVDLHRQLDYLHPTEVRQEQQFVIDLAGIGDQQGSLTLTFAEMMELNHRF